MSTPLPIPTCMAAKRTGDDETRHPVPLVVKDGMLYCEDPQFLSPEDKDGYPQSLALWAAKQGGEWQWEGRTLVFKPADPDTRFNAPV